MTKAEARFKGWARGRLDYKLWNTPQRIIEKKFQEVRARGGRFMFVNCARRSGKTFWVAKKAIETCIKTVKRGGNTKPRVKIGAAFYTDLEEFIVPAHEFIMEDKPAELSLRPLGYKKKFVCPRTGGEIKLVGLDLKPQGLRGTYADLIILEECGFTKNLRHVYEAICVPMGLYRPGFMVVMIGTPSETPDHDFVTYQEKAKLENAYIELDIDQNDRISPEEKAELIAEYSDRSTMMRELYCKVIVDATRAIIPEWNDEMAEVPVRDEWFKFYDWYSAMDLGIVDQTVHLWAWYDFRNAMLNVEDELMMRGSDLTTNLLAEALKAREAALMPENKKPHHRVSDTDNLLLLQDLRAHHGLSFNEAQKTTLHAMVNQVRVWVQQRRIRVHPRCKLLLGCLRSGIWDDRHKAFERSSVFGHYDALAALVYLVRSIQVNRNPIPDLYGATPDTHYIREVKKLTPDGETLQRALVNRKR